LSRPRESAIIRSVDALLTAEAAADLEVLNSLRPVTDTWGFLIGHTRGPRVLVERLFTAGAGAALPSPAELDAIDRGLGRRIVGLFAVRPTAAFRKAAAGPDFYGRLVLDIRPSRKAPVLRSFVVEFDGKFLLAPIVLRHGRKGGKP